MNRLEKKQQIAKNQRIRLDDFRSRLEEMRKEVGLDRVDRSGLE